MEVLVEPHKISQEVLLKVAAGIISKYEVHEINNIFSFVQDSNQAIQEMKLYSHSNRHSTQHCPNCTWRPARKPPNSSRIIILRSFA